MKARNGVWVERLTARVIGRRRRRRPGDTITSLYPSSPLSAFIRRYLRLSAFCLCALAVYLAAYGQNRGSLTDRLSTVKQRAAGTRKELAAAKVKAVRARNRLVESQEELAAAEARLSRARKRLEQTRRELVVVQANLTAARAKLAAHQDAMQGRLLALYRNTEPSYLEVLLHATDFEDFANRAEFNHRLAHRDETVLVACVGDKRRVEEQQRLLEVKQREQEELKARVAREKVAVAAKTQEARGLAQKAQSDVKEAAVQLAAEESEAASIGAALRRLAESRDLADSHFRYSGHWSGNFMLPVDGRVSCPYGPRIHPITHRPSFHNGVDLACPGGTPVHCAAAGTVVSTGWHGPYGLTVIVDHGSGTSTMYAHLERGSVQVSPGQTVKRGQTLARVDSTGWSTGNHLHWTVFKGGQTVNPLGQ